MIVLLTGAPGAGKGTQADLVAERCKYRKVSTGDALRRHVKNQTEIGKIAADIMASGKLVPDDVLEKILTEEIGTNSSEHILLDGYPRNVNQAKRLAEVCRIHKVEHLVHLSVPRKELMDRLGGRRVCSSCGASYHLTSAPPKKNDTCDRCGKNTIVTRPDDKPEKVSVRLDVYDQETSPVVEFYRSAGIVAEIDGTGAVEDVFERVRSTIEGH